MLDRVDDVELDENVQETAEEISTREGIYGEIKRALIARGIPAAEIAFIHDFSTPAKKAQAFADCNAGRIRVMLASTEKAGTGVNMQERLYALHHLDVPWRPSDVEQREGRILRQGNVHKEVHICQYVTEGSFDAYMWQTLESKARFISQIMAGEVTARTAEDVDQLVMTAAQIKAIASGNPQILEKVGLEVELTRLERLYSVWSANRHRMRRQLEMLPPDIEMVANVVAAHQRAMAARDRYAADDFQISLKKSYDADAVVAFTDRQRAGAHLRHLGFAIAHESQQSRRYSVVVGNYRGFEIVVRVSGTPADLLSSLFSQTEMSLRLSAQGKSDAAYSFNVGESDAGIIQSMDAQLRGLEGKLEKSLAAQTELEHRRRQIVAELGKGWEPAAKYEELKLRLDTLNQGLTKAGAEIEASPELSNLDEEAFRPAAPGVSVHQILGFGEQPVEAGGESGTTINDQAQVATEAPVLESESVIVVADELRQENGHKEAEQICTMADAESELKDDQLIPPGIHSAQPANTTKRRTASKSNAEKGSSQQMSFNWL
ncbi:MAG: helicase-related protein [Acidobacteriota bacterium]